MSPQIGIEAVSAIGQQWRHDGKPDALAFIASHPACAHDRQFVAALAYEEYCLRREAGESPDREAFCARFPPFQKDIEELLDVHSQLMQELPALEKAFPPRWPQIGDQVLGFVLREELGRGSFGRVFLAREPDLGNRQVVVKFSCNGATEANLLGPLRHPNVVRVHSVKAAADSGLTVVCMPYQGRTTLLTVLRRLFQGGPPASARALLAAVEEPPDAPALEPEPPAAVYARGSHAHAVLHLGAQLAEALAYLRVAGVTHSDVKPANILITPAGNAVLLDFNLATTQEEDTGRMAGTLAYMAPEQLRASRGHDEVPAPAPEAGGDVFVLGVILYELLTGQYPFGPLPEKLTDSALRLHLLERQRRGAPPIRSGDHKISPSLARLVERCLAWDPAARPGSAKDLAVRLRALLAPRRSRRRVAAAAASLLLAGLGWWSAHALRPAVVISQPVVAPPPGAEGRELLSKGVTAYRQKQYPNALTLLTDALVKTEDSLTRALILYLRGRTYQRLDDTHAALRDYQEAFALVPDWRVRACMGYCNNLLRRHKQAIEDHSWVLQAHPESAIVFNNRGYSRLRCGDLPSLRAGLADVQEALRQDPLLPAAHANRVRISLQLLHADSSLSATLTRAEVAQALASGPLVGAYAFDLTLLCSATARRQTDHTLWTAWVELGVDCAEQAFRLGIPRATLSEQRTSEQLTRSPRFLELLQRPQLPLPTQTVTRIAPLVDPVTDEPFDRLQAVPPQMVSALPGRR